MSINAVNLHTAQTVLTVGKQMRHLRMSPSIHVNKAWLSLSASTTDYQDRPARRQADQPLASDLRFHGNGVSCRLATADRNGDQSHMLPKDILLIKNIPSHAV